MGRLEEVRANRTLEETDDGRAVYNYEGNHFRVFASFDDGLEWLYSVEDRHYDLVRFETIDEDELDRYLLGGIPCQGSQD